MNFNKIDLKRGILEICFYLFIIGIAFMLVYFAGLSLRGFESEIVGGALNIQSYFGNYLLYQGLLIIAILLILFAVMNMFFIRKGETPWAQDKPAWYRIMTVSWIYNPEQSFLWFLFKKYKGVKEIKWMTNIVRILFLATIVFGILGLLQLFVPQLAVSGLPPTQQFTETSDIIFSSVIPSLGENGALLFATFLLSGLFAYLVARFVKNKDMRQIIFWTLFFFIVVPAMGLLWMSYHSVVYGNSEASLLATFLFGSVSIALIGLTGIFIFFFMGHFFNNFVLKLTQFIAERENLAIYYGIGIFIIIIIYLIFEYRTRKRRKRSAEQSLAE